MRTTLDIDDDVLMAAKEMARRENATTGQVISRMLRMVLTGHQGQNGTPDDDKVMAPKVGVFGALPTGKRVVSNSDVDALREADGF